MICKNCNGPHVIGDHDSGGCCNVAFCPCNNWEPAGEPAAPIAEELCRLCGRTLSACEEERRASFTAPIEPAADPPVNPEIYKLAAFPIETASFSELAQWGYKARDFIRGMK